MVDVSIGDRELDVMAALWRDGAGTVDDVRDRLPARLAYNTVLTILRNLEQKELVAHTVEGRLHRYHAKVAEQAVQRNLLSRLVDKVFKGSPVELLTHLVEHEKFSARELRALHQLLESRGAGTRGKKK